jgi:hypothetical protein
VFGKPGITFGACFRVDEALAIGRQFIRIPKDDAMYKIIGADGKEYGPISVEQLGQWVAEGRANAQTRVLPEGQTEWKTVAEVPELASIVAAPTPAPSSPTPGPLPTAPMGLGPKTSPLAITGLILGIVSVVASCCCYGLPFNVAGIIVSIIALNQIKNDPMTYGGKGMALAGLILSCVSILLAIGFLIFGIAMSGSDWMRKLQNR